MKYILEEISWKNYLDIEEIVNLQWNRPLARYFSTGWSKNGTIFVRLNFAKY